MFSEDSLGRQHQPGPVLDYVPPTALRAGVSTAWGRRASPSGIRDCRPSCMRRTRRSRLHGCGRADRSGDVQWTTAVSGNLHEEFHSEAFTRDADSRDWRSSGQPPRDGQDAPVGDQTRAIVTSLPWRDPPMPGQLRVIAGSYTDTQAPRGRSRPRTSGDAAGCTRASTTTLDPRSSDGRGDRARGAPTNDGGEHPPRRRAAPLIAAMQGSH